MEMETFQEFIYGLHVMGGKERAYDARIADIGANTNPSDRHSPE
jgi:hypothetical protein